jgi:hypothetical protein
MVNYYIDQMARESFIGTARRYTSVVKLSKLNNYNIKARWYASVDLLFTLVDSATEEPIIATTPVFISQEHYCVGF